jgi:Zn-finger protein
MLRPVVVPHTGACSPCGRGDLTAWEESLIVVAIGRNLTACELFPCVVDGCANPCLLCMLDYLPCCGSSVSHAAMRGGYMHLCACTF